MVDEGASAKPTQHAGRLARGVDHRRTCLRGAERLAPGLGAAEHRRVVTPETRYAKTADGMHIAYQVLGSGPIDLVWVPGFASNLVYMWTQPLVATFFGRLASFCRVIAIDRRGTGLSDRVSPEKLPSLEVTMDDIGAVIAAVGSDRAVLLGYGDGASICALFAATYPGRTVACVLLSAHARGTATPDYPWQWTADRWDEYLATLEDDWADRDYMRDYACWVAPSRASDDSFIRWLVDYYQLSASPRAVVALDRMYKDTDIRHILQSIRVPTLVIHRTGDQVEPVEGARYLSERIPGARFVELPGSDWLPFAGDQAALLDEVEEFLTGTRPIHEPDRILATVLFTDIVGSTQEAARLGDARWRELLAAHDVQVQGEVRRHRGKLIDTSGDGLLATFDGPARAVRCAQAIGDASRHLGIEIRAGCHTGEIELASDRVRGIAVHIGARVSALAGAGEVMVTSTVKDLTAGSGLVFDDVGERELKGVPDRWHIYRVLDRQ